MRKLSVFLSAGLLSLGFALAGTSASAAPAAAPSFNALLPALSAERAVQLAQWGPPPRRWRRPGWRRPGWRRPPPRRWRRPPPAYYGAPRPWTRAWYGYCASKYRSFDPRSGTYQPYGGGPRRLCR